MSSTPTRFDPIIQAVSRRAETIYSKMGIRRDESEDLARKKKGNGDNEASSIPWEDTTEVSIAALRGFLQDLLGIAHTAQQAPIPPISGEETLYPQSAAAPPPHPPNAAAAKAAHAYQATGKAVHDRNVETPPAPPAESATTAVHLGDDFGEDEKEKIRGYIQDMTELEQRGITTLTLRRTLTFLESIHQAIANMK
jgi:hypothetical protein